MQQVAALPYLTDSEIAEICDPLRMPSAQRRHLKSLGMLVKEKPNGRPLVARSEFERVLGAGRYAAANAERTGGPNVVAMQQHLDKRKGGSHAKTTQRR